MSRPTVKTKREDGDLLLFVEGTTGQRTRIRVCGSNDIMRIFVEHDETVEVEHPTEVATVRWFE